MALIAGGKGIKISCRRNENIVMLNLFQHLTR